GLAGNGRPEHLGHIHSPAGAGGGSAAKGNQRPIRGAPVAVRPVVSDALVIELPPAAPVGDRNGRPSELLLALHRSTSGHVVEWSPMRPHSEHICEVMPPGISSSFGAGDASESASSAISSALRRRTAK